MTVSGGAEIAILLPTELHQLVFILRPNIFRLKDSIVVFVISIVPLGIHSIFTNSDTTGITSFKCYLFTFAVSADSEIETIIDSQLSRDESGSWYCSSCNYSNHAKGTVRAHIEAKHVISSGYQCTICSKVCPTRHAFKMHRLRNKHWITKLVFAYNSIIILLNFIFCLRNRWIDIELYVQKRRRKMGL